MVYATYAIYFSNVFHSANLALITVTSIHNIQKMKQRQLKTRKQDGSLLIKSRQTIQVLKEKETSEKKVEKGVKEKNVFDTPCESNIKTVAEEHFSQENT